MAWVEKNPLPGTNGEKILKFCRDNDGYYVCEREGDVITCRQLNADGYLVRDRRDANIWYWTILGRDVLDRMEARRLSMPVPPLSMPEPEKRVYPRPAAPRKPVRKAHRIGGKIAYAGQEDPDTHVSRTIDIEFVRRFYL